MTKKELQKVLFVIFQADGGCPYCVKDLIKQLHNQFPKHKKYINKLVIVYNNDKE